MDGSKEIKYDAEALGGVETNTTYREGAVDGHAGETKRGLKSRHLQFL